MIGVVVMEAGSRDFPCSYTGTDYNTVSVEVMAMSRVRLIILVTALMSVVAGAGVEPVHGDTVIDVPPPPRPIETGSVALDIFADALEQVRSNADGQLALMHYTTRRFTPSNVYTPAPARVSSWSSRADAYAHAWYVNNGPRIWGTWWPWGGWGGCTMWTIGWPGQQHGGPSPGCGGSGMTFATLGGGISFP